MYMVELCVQLHAVVFISKPFFGFFNRLSRVWLGVDTIKNIKTDTSVQVLEVKEQHYHPAFINYVKLHDLQLLKVR